MEMVFDSDSEYRTELWVNKKKKEKQIICLSSHLGRKGMEIEKKMVMEKSGEDVRRTNAIKILCFFLSCNSSVQLGGGVRLTANSD